MAGKRIVSRIQCGAGTHAGLRSVIIVSGLFFLACCWNGASQATSDAERDVQPPGANQQAARPQNDPAWFERSDCLVKEAVCRSECTYSADEATCIFDRCDAVFRQCVAALPVGKMASLPAACVVQDKEAVRRIEKRGELLDADPTLFAVAYNTLVRARISCRAGLFSKAHAFYDEVLESLAEKAVPHGAGH